MKIIRFFASWCNSEECKSEFEKIYKLKENPKYGIDFSVTAADYYTHAVILNTAMPKLTISKDNVIGFAHEPIKFLNLSTQFIEYAKNHIKADYIGDKFNLPAPFIEGQGFLWRLPVLDYLPKKEQVMSIMVSHKNDAPGHRYRHKLVQAILKTNLPIDIWGNGTKFYNKLGDSRVKTDFPWSEINKMYEPYKFHIAIENFTTPYYMSEKVLNCFICSTMPIYWGCQNIGNYINNENIISLTKNLDKDEDLDKKITKDIELLKNICDNPDKYYNPIDIKDSKLNNLLNIFEFLEDKFNLTKI